MSIGASVEPAAGGDRHKQAMDRMYSVQRHFYDASRAYYLLGRDDLIAALQPPEGGSILEIGCGTGRNLLKIARLYVYANLYGVDISDEMLLSAGRAIERHCQRHRVQIAQGDAVTFSGTSAFGKCWFDRVYFSYALSMIPNWEAALRQAVTLTAPGGSLHVVDFGPCEGLPSICKSALYAWLNRFHVLPRQTLRDFAEVLAQEEGLQIEFTTSHRGYAQHLVLRKPP